MKKYAATFGLLALLGGIQFAKADVLDNVTDAKKIRIATDLAIPPFGYIDNDLKPTGFDVEVANLLASEWGLEVEFIQTVGATRIPNLLTDKADITISTLTITPERQKVVDFTRPYAVIQSVVGCLTMKDVRDWPDMKGETVAISRGSTQDPVLTAKTDLSLNIARYEDDATMAQAAISGQADCVATTTSMLKEINKKSGDRVFEPKIVIATSRLGIGVKPGEKRIIEKLNAWISTNLENGKFNEMYKKYLGVDLPKEF